jgi:hypothetical protein
MNFVRYRKSLPLGERLRRRMIFMELQELLNEEQFDKEAFARYADAKGLNNVTKKELNKIIDRYGIKALCIYTLGTYTILYQPMIQIGL